MTVLYNAETNLGHPDWSSLPGNLGRMGIGFLLVFLIMGILIGAVYLFRLIFMLIDRKKKPQSVSGAAIADTGETELVAAVAAAVYAVLAEERAEEEPVLPFTIKSIKRK